ncbi:MAG TPA: SDR family oxidoreductase, partial [candidate division Zixibacteria bacterium]|nr:SDR family oxidoreductase [candidate division Zixibacteria bacterium]
GAGGTLGMRALPILQERFKKARVTAVFHAPPGSASEIFDHSALGDLSDDSFVDRLIDAATPDLIINLAALTDVDRCEREPQLAKQLNVELVRTIQSQAPHARFVQISTDYVFNGKQGNYTPTDQPDPICVYGQSKLRAEELTLAGDTNLVIRTSGIYDWLTESNLFAFFFKRLMNGEPINALADCHYSPVWADDLARGLVGLIAAGATGLTHFAGPERLTRADFARTAAHTFELPANHIQEKSQREFNWAARRPTDSSLDSAHGYHQAGVAAKPPALAFAEMQLEMLSRPHIPGVS